MSVTDNNVADGITAAVVSVNVKDIKGTPVKDFTVGISVSGSNNVLVQCLKTDVNGSSRCLLYSTQAEKKLIRMSGVLNFSIEAVFHPPRADKSAVSIVSAGSAEILNSGHKMITTAGISETPAALADGTGAKRAHTSIQAVLAADED